LGFLLRGLEDIRVRLNRAAGGMNTAMYLYGKAEALQAEGKIGESAKVYEEAAYCLQKIVRLKVPEKPLHLAMADMYTKTGAHDRARLEYMLAWELDMEDQSLIERLIESSVAEFKSSEEHGPKKPYDVSVERARTARRYCSDRSEEYAVEAIGEMKSYHKEVEYGVDEYHTLGRLYRGIGRLEEALDCFMKAYELDISFERSVRFLINIYLDLGLEDRARALVETPVEETRGYHQRIYDVDVIKAWAAENTGDYGRAARFMEHAVARFPDDEVIKGQLEQYKTAIRT